MMSKKRILILIAAVAVFTVSGFLYYNTTKSFAYHLDKAKELLEELKSTHNDEATIEKLTGEVVAETEAALEAAEKTGNEKAKEEVAEVQEEMVAALEGATENEAEASSEPSETVAE